MTDLPDTTPEERDAIARLCGGVMGSHGYWLFGGKKTDSNWRISVLENRWLAPMPDSADEAIQTTILLRGLARAGVLKTVGPMYPENPEDGYVARPADAHWRLCSSVRIHPTPLAAMVALAKPHVRAEREARA